MKKSIFLSIALICCTTSFGQQIGSSDEIRIGHLDNGLTYYICHNENPAGCADFYIAHNVGAMQEEDNQNGLAHFLEHMAFNGTRHYPGKSLIDFLGDEGVRFGYNINAYTSRNETVYNINNVPLLRDSFVDSVLMILHDWSCDISCEQKALDDERGVISEEWRLRDEPRYRMMCRQMELVYRGGKQPHRTVIGSYDVINGFKREEILDFYDKWYRPDLQAILVVGDFDVDKMEAKVKTMFSDITMPSDPPQKPQSYTPAPQDEPIFADQTDPVIKYKAYKIIYKQPYPSKEIRGSEEYLRDYYCRMIVTSVLSDRLRVKAKEKGCPFNSAVFVTNRYEPDYYISLFTVTPKDDNDIASAVHPVLTEIERMLRYGISKEEFDVAVMNVGKTLHLDRELYPHEVKSNVIVSQCVEHFLRGYPLLTPIEWQSVQSRILSQVAFEDIAPYPAMMMRHNQVIYSNCHNVKDDKGTISEEVMKRMIAEVAASQIDPDYMEYPALDMRIDAPAGTIVKRYKDKGCSYERWRLSNGVTVYYRQCREVSSSNHFSMEATFDTGYRVYDQEHIASGKFISAYLKRFAGFALTDRMAMKNYPELSKFSNVLNSHPESSGFSFNAQKDGVENSFKALNLFITKPYFGTEKMFAKFRSDNLKSLGKPKNKRDLYSERVEEAYYGGNGWYAVVDTASIENLELKDVEAQYCKEFGDVSTMKVFISTDFDRSAVEDYVCRYVASIPRAGKVVKSDGHLWQGYKGQVKYSEDNEPLSSPMCDIKCLFSCSVKKDTKLRTAVAMLDYILSNRYLNVIREERGGAYHVAFQTELFDEPGRMIESSVDFQTRPELKEQLLKDVYDILRNMANVGPTDEEMNMASRFLVKYRQESLVRRENSVAGQLVDMKRHALYGIEYEYDIEKVISTVTPEYLSSLAGMIASGDRLEAVLVEK